ncbi:flagellar protein [Planococcus antarcticus DSM 14505]|uniref:Flagellar protein n=1 Tax=Planococcus antarcticus DSM 14505 TaxID=1185653 RepID=A0ABM6D9L8_9BACL|nr:flagellar protein [Planococcus antarcticus]ANU12122.1 flagellar protein [Planococcus antarcticus DSM 14505]
MKANQLDNCRICGTLFLKDYTDYCLDCYKEIEEEFKLVNNFLKIECNRFADIQEVSESTTVSVKQIADFIRDGRIYAEDFPNLGYPCKHCGKVIKRQILCDDCFEDFSLEIDATMKNDKFLEETGRKRVRPKVNAQYWKIR